MHHIWKKTAAWLAAVMMVFNMATFPAAAASEGYPTPCVLQTQPQDSESISETPSPEPAETPVLPDENAESAQAAPDAGMTAQPEGEPEEILTETTPENIENSKTEPEPAPQEAQSEALAGDSVLPEEAPVSAPLAAAEQNTAAKGKTYTSPAAKVWENADKQYPDHGGMLTDGIIHTDDASFAAGDDLAGWRIDSEQHYDFIVDLGGVHEITGYAIHGWCSNDTVDYIWNLRHYSVSYLDADGSWKTLEDKPDRLPYTPDSPACYTWQGSCAPVTASKVRFSLQGWSTGLFLSELEVFGAEAQAPAEDTYGNKAVNRPYTKSEPYQENGQILYPDTGDQELTDGLPADVDYRSAGWVGFAGAEADRFVQVDLGTTCKIDKAEVVYNVDLNVGIMAPNSIVARYSLNGADFYDFGTFQNLSEENGLHTSSLTTDPVIARYIRFDFEKKGWLFLSEVAAYGTKTEVDPKVPYLAKDLPAEQELYFGFDADLSVIPVIGTAGAIRYEWTKDGVLLEETGDRLTLHNVQADAAGVYQVTVINELDGQEYRTESRACRILVSEIHDMDTLLDVFRQNVPVIQDGHIVIADSNTSLYNVVLAGSDRESVIDSQGNVHQPLVDTTVNLLYKAVSTENPQESKIADYNVQIVVPGKYQKQEDDNKAPRTLPSVREWKGFSGNFELTNESAVIANTKTEKETAAKLVVFFKDVLKRDITVREGTAKKGDILIRQDDSLSELGAEGYLLEIGETAVIRAPGKTGLLYGAVSTVQALFADEQKTCIPQGIARDYPAYKVRGAFLDIARLGYPLDYLEEMTKYLAWFKMNEFHLHLNDKASQNYKSFRLESDLENLTSTDLYYTKQDYKAFQDMAADWGVSIISEIETPGHARAFRDVPGIKMTSDGDHLDISDAQTVETIKKLFDEMLDGDDPVIRNPVVHIGTDEFYAGTSAQLNEYVYDLTKHLEKKGITMRFWGAFLNNAGVPGGVDKTVPGSQCNIWASSGEWSDTLSPQQMMDYGYDLINSNGYNLYLVPGGQEYSDTLNHAALYNNWDVNHFDAAGKPSNIMPLGHPQILGANFLIWNDRGASNTGFSMFDTFTRFQNGTTILAEKTWHGPADKDQSYVEFSKRDKLFKTFVGGANPTRRVNSETSELVTLDFEDVSGNTVFDASGNHLDAIMHNARIADENGSSVLALDGSGFLSLGRESIGFPYEASFDLKLTQAPAANTPLLSGRDGTFYLNIDGTGKLGFKRDGFKVITPDQDVRFDRAEGYTFIFDYEAPLNRWTTIKLRSDAQFSYFEADGKQFKAVCTVTKLPGKPDRPLDESSISMFPTAKMFAGITGMVDNFTVRDPEIKGGERNPNLAFEKDVTASTLEDGSMYGRNFYPGALTDGIRNDVNTRVSFDSADDTTWAIVDLGKVQDVNLIKLFFFESCPEYKISVSQDGTAWSELLHETNGVHGRPESTDVEIDIPFDTQKVRYIKYEGLQKWQSQWGAYHGGLSELEAYNIRPDYHISVEKAQNGRLIVRADAAQQGEVITVKAKAAEGYRIKTVWVNDSVLTPENGIYHFEMPAKDVVLKAEFEKLPPETLTVAFDLQGHGDDIADLYVTKGETIARPAEPSARGWTFDGWYLEPECTTPWDFARAAEQSMTLYAKWTESPQVPETDVKPEPVPKPEPDKDPTSPEKPNTPDTGSNPTQPSAGNAGGKTPATGDGSHTLAWAALMLASLAAIVFAAALRKKTATDKE